MKRGVRNQRCPQARGRITTEKLKCAYAMIGRTLTVRKIAIRLHLGKTALYKALRTEPDPSAQRSATARS